VLGGVTPNGLPGQVNARYLFTLSVMGQGLGPPVIAPHLGNQVEQRGDALSAVADRVDPDHRIARAHEKPVEDRGG
jgi:hypothetical protein